MPTEWRKCGKLGHMAIACHAVIYCSNDDNQQPESAVVTVSRTEEKQFILPVYHTLYLLDLDKHLWLWIQYRHVLLSISIDMANLQQP